MVARADWKLKVVKESGIGLAGSVVGTALNYVLLMIVTRALSPTEYGTFALAQSVTTIALILALFGTPRALDRFIPLYNARGDYGRTRTLISRIFGVTLVAGVVAAAALILGSGLIARAMPNGAHLAPVLAALALSVPLLVYVEQVGSSFVGFKELRYQAYVQQLALPVLRIALVAVAFAAGFKLYGWVAAYLVSLVVAAALAFAFYRRLIAPLLRAHAPVDVSLKETATYSWPLTVNNIVLVFFGQVGILFLGRYWSLADVGVFRVYVYVVLVMVMVRASFTKIYKPVASEMLSTGDHEELGRAYARVARWMFIPNSAIFLVIALFGSRALVLLLGAEYQVVPVALVVLAAGRLLVSSLGPQGMTLEAFGHTRLSMVNAFVMVGANVGLCALLVPGHGILGAAVAASASASLGALAGLAQVFVLHRMHPFGFGFTRCVGAALAVWLLGGTQAERIGAMGLGELTCAATATLTLYALGLVLVRGFDATDRQVLAEARDRVLRRGNRKAEGGNHAVCGRR
ncbi:MAG: oligosaccharide flippase family protein [Candidatus Eisenbacteria bacterium]